MKPFNRYQLYNRRDCDAAKYKLQGGRDFDRWFAETYTRFYDLGEGEEVRP